MVKYVMQSKKINAIFEYFRQLFGEEPRTELNYETDIQLLVSIILSAQCTDVRVNKVTPALFRRFKTAEDFANANITELQDLIRSTGFFRNKAANIKKMAVSVVELHNGVIPKTMEELIQLAGVGRKTASVFLAEFHKIPAIAVDTHVMRVSRRLGLSNGKNPEQIEGDLKACMKCENWCKYHLYMVFFGRYRCRAKKPECDGCKLREYCNVFRQG